MTFTRTPGDTVFDIQESVEMKHLYRIIAFFLCVFTLTSELTGQTFPIFTVETEAALEPMIKALEKSFPGVSWEIVPPSGFVTNRREYSYDFAILMISEDSAGEFNSSAFSGIEDFESGKHSLGDKSLIASSNGLWNGVLVTQTVIYTMIPEEASAYDGLIHAVASAARRLGYSHPLAGNQTGTDYSGGSGTGSVPVYRNPQSSPDMNETVAHTGQKMRFINMDRRLKNPGDNDYFFAGDHQYLVLNRDEENPRLDLLLDGVSTVHLEGFPVFGAGDGLRVNLIDFSLWDPSPEFSSIMIKGTDIPVNLTHIMFVDNPLITHPVLLEGPTWRRAETREPVVFGPSVSEDQKELLDDLRNLLLHSSSDYRSLILPFRGFELGGNPFRTVSSFSFDISFAFDTDRNGSIVFNPDAAPGKNEFGQFLFTSYPRRPDFTLRDVPPTFSSVFPGDKHDTADGIYRNLWVQAGYPLQGSGAIWNYIYAQTGFLNVPLIVYNNSGGNEDFREAVQLFFGKGMEEIDRQVEEQGFFYKMVEFRPDLPSALLVGVKDTETFRNALKNNSDFKRTIEEFYNQSYP